MFDKIRVRINKHYQKIMELDNFITAEKVNNVFLGLEHRYHTLLHVFQQHNEDCAKRVETEMFLHTNKHCCTNTVWLYVTPSVRVTELFPIKILCETHSELLKLLPKFAAETKRKIQNLKAIHILFTFFL